MGDGRTSEAETDQVAAEAKVPSRPFLSFCSFPSFSSTCWRRQKKEALEGKERSFPLPPSLFCRLSFIPFLTDIIHCLPLTPFVYSPFAAATHSPPLFPFFQPALRKPSARSPPFSPQPPDNGGSSNGQGGGGKAKGGGGDGGGKRGGTREEEGDARKKGRSRRRRSRQVLIFPESLFSFFSVPPSRTTAMVVVVERLTGNQWHGCLPRSFCCFSSFTSFFSLSRRLSLRHCLLIPTERGSGEAPPPPSSPSPNVLLFSPLPFS